MKAFLLTIVLLASTAMLAGAAYAQVHQRYPYRNCQHNNSKACQDARKAFAEHHNGLYPEQWFNSYYQGQPGRWAWENAEGDDWFQGEQGHWYKEPEGWRFWGDDGDAYRKGDKGWGWIRGRGHQEREEHEHEGSHDHDHH